MGSGYEFPARLVVRAAARTVRRLFFVAARDYPSPPSPRRVSPVRCT